MPKYRRLDTNWKVQVASIIGICQLADEYRNELETKCGVQSDVTLSENGPVAGYWEQYKQSSCLHRTSMVSRHFLLFQMMHTIIKIIEMLKQLKIIILAPACFGSRRNHRQGAVMCLAKTTNMGFLCTLV
jgi:hypothetical protein